MSAWLTPVLRQFGFEHGTLFGELPSGGFDQITENPEVRTEPDEEALDAAAMEAGND